MQYRDCNLKNKLLFIRIINYTFRRFHQPNQNICFPGQKKPETKKEGMAKFSFWHTPSYSINYRNLLIVHGNQEFFIGIRFLQPVFHKLHSFHGIHIRQVIPQNPDAVHGIFA